MRASKHTLWAVIALLLAAMPVVAQQRAGERARPSPNASVAQTIALTQVSISYGRPGVKGRKIWGELVPLGELWRAGANEATTITFSADVRVEGQPLTAGTYSLFTVPGAAEWTIVFNKNAGLWGTGDYKEAEDALRVKVKPRPAEHEEWMSFRFEDLQAASATVTLRWEKLAVSFRLEVPAPPPPPPPAPAQK